MWTLRCRQWYIDEVRQHMRDRIQQNYGIDLETSEYNAGITHTWNVMQEYVSIAWMTPDSLSCWQ